MDACSGARTVVDEQVRERGKTEEDAQSGDPVVLEEATSLTREAEHENAGQGDAAAGVSAIVAWRGSGWQARLALTTAAEAMVS